MIEFLNLKAVNQRYVNEIQSAVERVLKSGWYLLGKELEQFERNFADYCGFNHAVGVASGLDALILIIRAYNIGPGDEIIVPSNTYIASVIAVTACQATPVFIEPDPLTHLIDPDKIEEKISERTKAIMPVHLYGQICEMGRIVSLANKYNLKVIDDAAQAHGVMLDSNLEIKNFKNRALAFSFYPSKNLGAMADAGAVVTNDDELVDKLKALRNYGSHKRYFNKYLGANSRMDEMQASILNIKLQHLENDNLSRRDIAEIYLNTIENQCVTLPPSPKNPNHHVWHLFVVTTPERNKLRSYLESQDIQTQIHYPVPPHKQNCYQIYNDISLPIAEKLANEVLSLPLSPVFAKNDAKKIADAINAWN